MTLEARESATQNSDFNNWLIPNRTRTTWRKEIQRFQPTGRNSIEKAAWYTCKTGAHLMTLLREVKKLSKHSRNELFRKSQTPMQSLTKKDRLKSRRSVPQCKCLLSRSTKVKYSINMVVPLEILLSHLLSQINKKSIEQTQSANGNNICKYSC